MDTGCMSDLQNTEPQVSAKYHRIHRRVFPNLLVDET